ncbi:MAG: UDP-3-O-(3-hydroxymyristoyl)glucosamine N-acyltransferase [Alphaproteobacteria bacterium]|nr:UDP-3-O-(3-hydroxymyristoyl)glucosamine N-acyltransferase [Alphaproteobacteria bacterium]
MADSRFHHRQPPMKLGEVAAKLDGRLENPADADFCVVDVAALEIAKPDEMSFYFDAKYRELLAATKAGAIFIREKDAQFAPVGCRIVITDHPYRNFAQLAQMLYPPPPCAPGIAASAVIDQSAKIGVGAAIEAGVVIEAGVEIGANTRIGANSVVARNVVIGANCDIASHVSISHAILGDQVRILPGVRIGQPGFGFLRDGAAFYPLMQLGRVIIGNQVEIGANSTIDRGASGDTIIGDGSMIDNLCQIGHNVVLGRGCILSGQVGISGSTVVGDYVMMGGQAGIADHLNIGARAKIAAKAGVMRDVAEGETVAGLPAQNLREHFRQVAWLKAHSKKSEASHSQP